MKTKINISPEMREFNDAVELADCLTDYRFDKCSAQDLLRKLEREKVFPHSVNALANAIAGISVRIRPSCHCGNPDASWHGDNYNLRQFMCDKCWSEEQSKR